MRPSTDNIYACAACGSKASADSLNPDHLCLFCLPRGVHARMRPAGQPITLHYLISERVMGWGSPNDSFAGRGAARDKWWLAHRLVYNDGIPYCQSRHPSEEWNPTRNPAHALEVSERMRDLGIELHMRSIETPARAWVVEATHKVTGERCHSLASDFAIAICKAAARLLAPEVTYKL